MTADALRSLIANVLATFVTLKLTGWGPILNPRPPEDRSRDTSYQLADARVIERYHGTPTGSDHNADHTARTAKIITAHSRAARTPITSIELPSRTLVFPSGLARSPG